MQLLKDTLYRLFLLTYTIVASVLLGGFAGFLVIYPLLQVIFNHLENNYEYDQMIHNFVYLFVVCAIAYCFQINWKRYTRHLRKAATRHSEIMSH